jgi:hypothetical protein
VELESNDGVKNAKEKQMEQSKTKHRSLVLALIRNFARISIGIPSSMKDATNHGHDVRRMVCETY